MAHIEQEMPSLAEKLKMLEIENIDKLTAKLKQYIDTAWMLRGTLPGKDQVIAHWDDV